MTPAQLPETRRDFYQEAHAARRPSTWRVVKVGDRLWYLVAQDWEQSGSPLDSFTTKRAATAALTSGFHFDLWHKEGRWIAGESITGWKPYTTVRAEHWAREDRSMARLADFAQYQADGGKLEYVDWWREMIAAQHVKHTPTTTESETAR